MGFMGFMAFGIGGCRMAACSRSRRSWSAGIHSPLEREYAIEGGTGGVPVDCAVSAAPEIETLNAVPRTARRNDIMRMAARLSKLWNMLDARNVPAHKRTTRL